MVQFPIDILFPSFFDPNYDTVVECLPTCCDDQDNPPKFPPTTSGKHLIEKYKKTRQDFEPFEK